jgi:hypothetical protein
MRATRRRSRSIAAMLGALLLAVACERATASLPSSAVVARLVSTHSDDGASLIGLTGDVSR